MFKGTIFWGTAVKKNFAAAAIAAIFLAGAADAGSLADPVVAPEVVAADSVKSSNNVEGLIAAVTVMTIILGAASAF